jgi:hypothetical protein
MHAYFVGAMLGLCLVAVLAVVVPSITASESSLNAYFRTAVSTKVVRSDEVGHGSHAPPHSALDRMRGSRGSSDRRARTL